jgi:hypothetical protein
VLPYALEGLYDFFKWEYRPFGAFLDEYQPQESNVVELAPEYLNLLSQPLDGVFDGPESSSCRSWKCLWHDSELDDYFREGCGSRLLDCAYVIWDYSGISDKHLSERFRAIREHPIPSPQSEPFYLSEEEARSVHQRYAINLRGGQGWWHTKSTLVGSLGWRTRIGRS